MSALNYSVPEGIGRSFPLSPGGRRVWSRLLTRTQFLDRARRELARAKRCIDQRSVVLSIDIDRFKVVSASLGREFGDRVLDAIADRIHAQLSSANAIARLGGDEFAVIIEEPCNAGSAIDLAEAIQRELISGFEIDGTTVYTTASIGIARITSNYSAAEDILRDAEIAMYHAKDEGRARSEIFHSTMLSKAVDQFEMETDLRRAVERGEFELFFQPIVSTHSGKVRAFESLLRWRHPSRGLQSPSSFLALLKETGLIMSVGRWVVNEACGQAKKWQDLRGHPIPVTINLAPQQFTHTPIVDMVAEAIEASGVDPSAIVLEITEDALLEDMDAARATLLPLRERGVRVMIDDFGTGYSSLSYLRRLPIDAIKIDASFVDRIERFTEDRLIVRAIVALAHALDLCVIAEGVERREQLVEPGDLDCEEVQGFMISRPIDAAAATELVATRWVADFALI